MKTYLTSCTACVFIIFGTVGCASIVSKSSWPVTIRTNPAGANIIVKDEKGGAVHNAVTPATVTLPASDGFFSKAHYTVEIARDGYNPTTVNITPTLNGWYIGNIVFGGLIGWLIVDPATGAMYKLPEGSDTNLTPIGSPAAQDGMPRVSALQIRTIDEIPASLRDRLVRLN